MSIIRAILFLPILLFGLPTLALLFLIILIAETPGGPARSLLAAEVRRYGLVGGFRRFMETVFVPTFKTHLQSFVLGAAGFLIVAVGLRGLGVIPVLFVYVALAVEFTLLTMWAVTVYYSSDDDAREKIQGKKAQPNVPEKLQDLIDSMKDLGTHIAFLERRLAVTESKFENIGKLDGAMQNLSAKLHLLVGDQLSVRVRREFEQMLVELTHRAANSYDGDKGSDSQTGK